MRIGRVGRLIGTGMAVTMLGALAGCSWGSATAATGGLEQTTITVDSVPAAEEGGLYTAAAMGFFAQQGLTVKIVSITGGEAGIPDLQSGKADLVDGNYVSFILAQMEGKFGGKPVDMRLIAASSALQPGSEALYVAPHSRYQTIADLAQAHAKIGLNTPNDVGDVLLGATYKEAGYSFKGQPKVIPPDGFPALITMLAAGQVDAIWLPQPLGAMAEQQIGAVPLVDFDQGSLQDFPFTGVVGATPWVRSHPNTVAAFLRALNQGQRLADTDRGAVERAMQKYTGIPPIIADTMAIDSFPLEMDIPQLQRVPDSMFEFGLTPQAKAPFQIATMIEPEPGLVRG